MSLRFQRWRFEISCRCGCDGVWLSLCVSPVMDLLRVHAASHPESTGFGSRRLVERIDGWFSIKHTPYSGHNILFKWNLWLSRGGVFTVCCSGDCVGARLRWMGTPLRSLSEWKPVHRQTRLRDHKLHFRRYSPYMGGLLSLKQHSSIQAWSVAIECVSTQISTD